MPFSQEMQSIWREWPGMALRREVLAQKYSPVLRVVNEFKPGGALPETTVLYMDWWHGACRAACQVEDARATLSKFRLSGQAAWKKVMTRQTDPIQAMKTGQIKCLATWPRLCETCARLLGDVLDPGRDPPHPDNLLLFITGLLTGARWPAAGRFTGCGRSPQTGLWVESNIGGFVGPEPRYAGRDALDIPMTDRFTSQGKAALVARRKHWRTVCNDPGMCFFAVAEPGAVLDLVNAFMDGEWSLAELQRAGERGWYMKRLVNLRLGLDPAEERLPRLLREPLVEGGQQGHLPDMQTLLNEYYAASGWERAPAG